MAVAVLVITGSMGSGKTTVMAEASDLLRARGVIHAAIDLDALDVAHLPGNASNDLAYRNLASVWQNFAAAGVTTLLLAEAIESTGELDRLREAIPECEILVCRLTARLETMRQRVSLREPGIDRERFIARVGELESVIDEAKVEDFAVGNDDRSVTETARELLTRAGWI